jgi:PIF1-like helicase
MDQLDDEDEVLTGPSAKGQGHFQYVGGSGGTGKSWLINAIQTVITTKGVKKEMVITATSGTAAAGIGGNTIHAIGLTFKNRDGQVQDSMPQVSDERRQESIDRRRG